MQCAQGRRLVKSHFVSSTTEDIPTHTPTWPKQIKGGTETTKKEKKQNRQALNPFGHFQRDKQWGLAVGAAKTPPFFISLKVTKWDECLPFLLFLNFLVSPPPLIFVGYVWVCLRSSNSQNEILPVSFLAHTAYIALKKRLPEKRRLPEKTLA